MAHDRKDLDAFGDAVPDPRLEEKVVGELSRRGLLSPAARARRPWPLAIAAAVALAFGAGWVTARAISIPRQYAVAPTGRWVMLLYRIPGEKPATEQVAEYRS